MELAGAAAAASTTTFYPIIGTYEGEVDRLSPPLSPDDPAPRIDQTQRIKWINAHEKKHQNLLTTVIGKVEIVSFAQFTEALEGCLKQLPKSQGPTISLVEPGKSQAWVNELAAFRYNTVFDHYVRLGEEAAASLPYSLSLMDERVLTDPRLTVYIIDDGSYSGNQMAFNLSGVSRVFREYGATPEISVIIPFITNVAIAKIKTTINELPNKVTFLFHQVIPTLQETLERHLSRKVDQERALELVFSQKEDPKSRKEYSQKVGLVIHAHKVPNAMSFPDEIAQGYVQGGRSHRFIPEIEPPYKKEPVDPEKGEV